MRNVLPGIAVLLSMVGCGNVEDHSKPSEDLFDLFNNPPSDARPFVRWWWNGDCIEIDELQRELDVMKAAGIGGVEINPIAKPDGGDNFKYSCYEWLSPEWNERVKATINLARERDMIVDLIMGSGWPFGGEFLKEDQFLQGVGIRKMELEGPRKYTFQITDIWQLPGRDFGSYDNMEAPDPTLFFLQMISHGASSESGLVDLKNDVDLNGMVEIHVPEGKHDLYIGAFQKAYRTVMFGAPGSKGPVLNHYSEKDVRAYMDNLANALESVLGGKLGDHFRSLFCDSIELSGANITDDFFEEFLSRRGYDLGPFLPLVYYHPYEGYTDTLHYEPGFNEDIRRIRYDFNKTLVELFLERFPRTFDQWSNEHGMQSRYQAYGMPWLVGMLDGYRMVDIPESNNWLFSFFPKSHGYWIWNKYASSAAHLSGANVVSSEAMTNTSGVFRATLDMIKKNDDFNFISGINHSILHGYNYSPPEAGFPGWVRFGAYFSDQNTWWPYFHYWTEYNARLSALFQHSEPVVDVAILTPEADIWKQHGLYRNPYYLNPWYHHDLWEGFSRVGVSADYINEGVIQRASANKGILKSEEASYQLVIVSGAKSMEPKTAKAIHDLAEKGVNFLFIDHMPSEAPSYFEKDKNDLVVEENMQASIILDNVSITNAPEEAALVTSWAAKVTRDMDLKIGIEVTPVNENLYLAKYRSLDKEIYFFSSQDDHESLDFTVNFNNQNKTAWLWDPYTGKRYIYPAGNNGALTFRLQALESLLMVLEDDDKGETLFPVHPDEGRFLGIGTEWIMDFNPVHAERFVKRSNVLFDFGTHPDKRISSFAGQVSYQTKFELTGTDWDFLDLGLEKHVTEVKINHQKLGVRWSGRHLYQLDRGILKEGENSLEITYTTTLANYAHSLSENAVAKRWIDLKEPDPMGLISEVRLMKSE